MRLRHWNFKLGALRMEASLRDFYKKATKMWGPQDVLHYLFSHQNDIQNAKTIDMILQHSLWLVTGKTHYIHLIHLIFNHGLGGRISGFLYLFWGCGSGCKSRWPWNPGASPFLSRKRSLPPKQQLQREGQKRRPSLELSRKSQMTQKNLPASQSDGLRRARGSERFLLRTWLYLQILTILLQTLDILDGPDQLSLDFTLRVCGIAQLTTKQSVAKRFEQRVFPHVDPKS